MNYNHPHYLVLREAVKEPHVGALTAAGATGGIVGTTFRTFHKAVVFGCSAQVVNAGSGGNSKVVVSRMVGVGNTVSLTAYTIVDTSLAANAQTNLTFSTPLTLTSIGDCVMLHGSASAATDIPEFNFVIWRYRYLPNIEETTDGYTSAQLG